MAPDASLASAGRVEQCRLQEDSLVFGKFVVIGELYGDGLVAVDGAQFDVCGVGHVEVAVVEDWADAWFEYVFILIRRVKSLN